MTTIWATIIILGVLIAIHEFGHFIAARSVGVRVERFSIGIPPRIFTIDSIDNGFLFNIFFFHRSPEGQIQWGPVYQKKINVRGRIGSNTEYVIALLPLGGYVKMSGLIDESMDNKIEYKDHEFMSKPLWAKLWVLIAGVLMNTILAFFIFSTLGYYQGSPELVNEPLVAELYEDKPAINAGILPGDKIIKINEKEINTWENLSKTIHAKPNEELKLTIDRKGLIKDIFLTTTFFISPTDTGMDTLGAIGIMPKVVYTEMTYKEATLLGFSRTISSFFMIFNSLKMLSNGDASFSDFGGPIMIAQLAGETAEAGIVPFLTFMALLSINLAFLNILPIPGLDGGHIFIHIIESLIRKPLTIKSRVIIQQIGMAFLLVLMINVIFQDVVRLFH